MLMAAELELELLTALCEVTYRLSIARGPAPTHSSRARPYRMAKVDDVREALELGGLTFLKRRRNGTNTGDQLRFEGGEIVNVLDSGKISVQGKNVETVQAMLAQHTRQEESRASPAASSLPPARGRKRRASRRVTGATFTNSHRSSGGAPRGAAMTPMSPCSNRKDSPLKILP